jgi:immunity protein Imm1 of predicted polymorphic toxin system
MIDLSISVHDGEEATHVSTSAELDRVIQSAGEGARARGKLNVILLETPRGNQLGMVVGGAETVLTFTYGHRGPPYYVSRGAAKNPRPVITAFLGLAHHTEFRRTYVVPYAMGLLAAREFAETGSLPSSVEWVTV